MFSCNRINDVNDPNLRGEYLLSQITQKYKTYPDVEIYKVHAIPGHILLRLSPLHRNIVVVLDNVPQKRLVDQEYYSMELLESILRLNEKKEVKTESPAVHEVDVHKTKAKGFNFKNFLRNFKEPTKNEESKSPPLTKPKEPTFIDHSCGDILCISTTSPIVEVHLEEIKDVQRLYILTQDANLHSWKWNEETYSWKFTGQRTISTSKIEKATFITTLTSLVWYDEHGLYQRKYKFTEDNLELESKECIFQFQDEDEKCILDIQEGRTGIWIFQSTMIHHITLSKSQPYPTSTIQAIDIRKHPYDAKAQIIYCCKCIHPISKEVVLLSTEGIPYILSISPINKIITTSPLEKMTEGIEAHLREFQKEKPQKRLKTLEMFFLHQSLLCISNGDACMFYMAKTSSFLGKTLLPTDIAMDDSIYGDEKSILWTIHGNEMRMGVFCAKGLYTFQTPPMIELLKISSTNQNKRNSKENFDMKMHLRNLYDTAMLAKEWNLNGHYIKYLLDFLINQSKLEENDLQLVEKNQLFNTLCDNLQSPVLIWSTTNSLREQEILAPQVAKFIKHFPLPNSHFWKNEKMKSQINNQNWEFINDLYPNEIPPKSIFEKLTPLNLQVVQPLAESLALSKTQLETLKKDVTSEKKTLERDMVELTRLTDTELEILSKTNPLGVLTALCHYWGIESFIELSQTEEKEGEKVEFSFKDMNSDVLEDECHHLYAKSYVDEKTNRLMFKYQHNPNEEIPPTGCLHFEILCKLLFESKRPSLVLNLIEMMDQLLKTVGNKSLKPTSVYKQELAERALDWLGNLYYTSSLQKFSDLRTESNYAYSPSQSLVIAQLMIWNDDIKSAIKVYLDCKLVDKVIEVLIPYLEKKDRLVIHDHDIFQTILQFCMREKIYDEKLWDLLWKFMPQSSSVFHFKNMIHIPKKEKKSIFSEKKEEKIETYIQALQKFTNNLQI